MKKVKFGIIGTNFISDWFCEAAEASGAAQCVCVYSRTEETGRAFAEKHGIPHYVTDYASMLDGSVCDIDAVYVASPHFCHMEQSVQAMQAKKHVLVEKPAALNFEQFACMWATAEDNGVVLAEAMRPIFDPALELIKAQLPKLGTIRQSFIDYSQYSSRYDKFLAGTVLNAFKPELSNAAIMDIGVYCFAVAEYLFGEPKDITAKSVFLHNGFEACGTAIADYGDHLCQIRYSKVVQSQNVSTIEGEKGTLYFEAVSKPRNIYIVYRDGRREDLPFTPAENNMVYEIRAFARMIAEEEPDDAALKHTLAVVRMMDASRRSSGVLFPNEQKRKYPVYGVE